MINFTTTASAAARWRKDLPMLFFIGNETPGSADTFVSQSLDLALTLAAHEVPARVLTLNYDRLLTRTPASGGAAALALNLWDELQKVGQLKKRVLTFRDLNLGNKQDWWINLATQEYRPGDRRFAVVHTIADSPQIDYVDYYARPDEIRKRDFFDRRGFRSVSQYLNTNGTVEQEIYWDVHGAPVLEHYFEPVPHQAPQAGMVLLPRLGGREMVFPDMAAALGVLATAAIAETHASGPATIVAQDAPEVLAAVQAMNLPRRFVFAHRSSLTQQTEDDALWTHVQTLLAHYAGVIVPDQLLATRWAARTGETIRVAQFPVHATFPATALTPLAKRPAASVLTYLDADPQGTGLKALMTLFTTLRQAVPHVRLTIYQPQLGAATVPTGSTHPGGSVQFISTPAQWREALATHQVYASVRAFPAAAVIISALAHGLAVVAASDHAGAWTPFVRADENGVVVPAANSGQFAAAVKQLVRHKKALNTAEKTSLALAQDYTEQAVIAKWQAVDKAGEDDGNQ
ncbi:glycosyltransferase [Schleiferilactobacillus shenzhenensis]|uniref:Glycosyl transferase family 1 domain-containing protein n=1 Tax=Schleiferilactobacillus shenzhenensis LY-73 TaxID=1231336 RepID=U4TS99_9LACO|nr:hypothetical protein [Schleiferilactobacillus shenzhenensis]ERL64352.1 hypothetical protein L248_1015 [Schleiferilactobacillus shenzhenensis LY-73]